MYTLINTVEIEGKKMFVSINPALYREVRISDTDPKKMKESFKKSFNGVPVLGLSIFSLVLLVLNTASITHVSTTNMMQSPSLLGILYILLWVFTAFVSVIGIVVTASEGLLLEVIEDLFHKPTRISNYINMAGKNIVVREWEYSDSSNRRYNNLFLDYLKSLDDKELVEIIENRLEADLLKESNKKISELLNKDDSEEFTDELKKKLRNNTQRLSELTKEYEAFDQEFIDVCKQLDKSERQKEILNVLAS